MVELVNLELAILKGLRKAELETLEFLLDEEASRNISQSLKSNIISGLAKQLRT